ncbi:MAG: FtsX-like permease family protein [Ruminococcaceae bacterium]|nr:FtsX-like permease family protein [Oscillospiraceae bacterium]
MERLFGVLEYLKRSLTIARKSIFFNFKQYIYFFIALLIVQMFYGIMTISAYNNEVVERASATEVYDYDIMLTHLNETQYDRVKTYRGEVVEAAKYYTITEEMESVDDIGDKYYDIRIKFTKNDPEKYLNQFKKDYYNAEEDTGALIEGAGTDNTFYFYESPRLLINSNIAAGNAEYYLISAVLLGLSIFLMTSLYNIRVNQYKFTYGVYMTYGADFKKLFITAFWEMFMISCITFIPSVILSTVVVYLIYLPSGFEFTFSALVFLQVFIFSLIVVLFAVFFPMRIMAIRQPMSLIVTQDNSNLVSSPKHSINIFKKKFPTKYELYSAWRFRKHSASLLATAIVFCAFFIMGLYLADIYTTDLEYKRPDFKVNLEDAYFFNYSDDEDKTAKENEIINSLYNFEGVEAVQVAGNSMIANGIESHILVDDSDVKFMASDVIDYTGDAKKDVNGDALPESLQASSMVSYNATSVDQIGVFEKFYTVKGDLESIKNENTVIIGESISNIATFKYDVGDTIYIAVRTDEGKKPIDSKITGEDLLREQIKRFDYEYVPFTIGAILTDIPSGEMPVFLSADSYELITGDTPKTNKLDIFIDQSLDSKKLDELEDSIREWSRENYYNGNVENTYQISRNNVAADKHNNELYVCISILLLVISPIMWFFSQGLYYMKRESEFNILQALGAKVKEIRQIYVQGGLIMAGLSLVVSTVLSFLGSYALFYVYNVIMPYFTHENVRYAFYMPWYALLISIVVSVACGFLSAYIPFRSYYKNRFTLQNGGAGEYGD